MIPEEDRSEAVEDHYRNCDEGEPKWDEAWSDRETDQE